MQIRQQTNVHRYTVQCVLPINLFNEKIFIFIWFWLLAMASMSIFNIIHWLTRQTILSTQTAYVRRQVHIHQINVISLFFSFSPLVGAISFSLFCRLDESSPSIAIFCRCLPFSFHLNFDLPLLFCKPLLFSILFLSTLLTHVIRSKICHPYWALRNVYTMKLFVIPRGKESEKMLCQHSVVCYFCNSIFMFFLIKSF